VGGYESIRAITIPRAAWLAVALGFLRQITSPRFFVDLTGGPQTRAVLARINSFVLTGIDAIPCEVEADVSQRGLSKVTLVGLPQAAVKESIERVRLWHPIGGYRADGVVQF
jgi:hypothetical protein